MPPLTLSGTDGIDVGTTNVIDENGNILINGDVLSDGNSIRVPSGTTGERPASPTTGELRFNTDTSSLEQYNGTNWGAVVPDDLDINTLSINGTQVVDSTGNVDTGSLSIGGSEVISSTRDLVDINTLNGAVIGISKPNITSPADGATVIFESPTITSSSFTGNIVPDTHASTDWQIASDSSFNTIVVESLNDTSNLVSWTVPEGNLSTSTTYYIRVRHTGTNLGDSEWSNTVSFTTASEFLPASWPGEIGTAYEGGYFAGQIDQGGTIYNLIVAPKASGENSSIVWADGAADGSTTGAYSDIDGPSNTATLVSSYSSTDTEAAHFCDGLTIGGYSDWYMPAKNELEVLYYWLKPTTDSNDTGDGANPNAVSPEPINTDYSSSDPAQTSVTVFQDGNSEAFYTDNYWSSTEVNSPDAWTQNFDDGERNNYFNKFSSFSVRAVRRVAV